MRLTNIMKAKSYFNLFLSIQVIFVLMLNFTIVKKKSIILIL